METKQYSLIVDYSVWGTGKDHIAKEINTVHTMCGVELGFNYSPLSVSGSEGGETRILTAEEIISRKSATCKKCLKSLKLSLKDNV